MSREDNKAIVRRLTEAINLGNPDILDEILAPDYIRNDPTALLKDRDREKIKQAVVMFHRAFPDLQLTEDELLVDGDKVIGRWTFRGTHTGQFGNLQPSSKHVTFPIFTFYRIEDGRIAEDWHIFDALGFWEQLVPEIGELRAQAQG